MQYQASAAGACVYSWIEDNPAGVHLQFETMEDFLQFQIEEDMITEDPSLDVHGLSVHDVRATVIEKGKEG